MQCSFLEVYCERVKDLLSVEPQLLEVRENKQTGVQVPGLTYLDVKSREDVMDKLHEGNTKRTVRATNSNEVSSRSHAVFQIRLSRMYKDGPRRSTLSLIDLAGSERLKKIRSQRDGREGGEANQSIFACVR